MFRRHCWTGVLLSVAEIKNSQTNFATLFRVSSLPFKLISNASSFYSTAAVRMAKKTAIILLADGAEEMEAVITIDILRRAQIDVTVATITDNKTIKCSREVKLLADEQLSDAIKGKTYDVVILPGGLGGSKALASSAEVGALLKAQESENRVIAAICAAPTALKAHGIAKGKQVTSYPSMKNQLTADYKYVDNQQVVTDGNLITSQGPATAFAFALAIVDKLLNKEAALPVAEGLLYKDYK